MNVIWKVCVIFKYIVFANLFFYSIIYAIDCDPIKPKKPVESEVQNNLKIKANIISKLLGSGNLVEEYKKIERDIRSEFPNADQILLNEQLLYLTCSLIKKLWYISWWEVQLYYKNVSWNKRKLSVFIEKKIWIRWYWWKINSTRGG